MMAKPPSRPLGSKPRGPDGGFFIVWSQGMDFQHNAGPETANEEEIFVPSDDVREHLVVVGNGMAGCRAVEELLARDAGRYRVTIFGAEPYVNYNRIMLSPVLAGEKSL